jgi:hypothetical protein
MNVLTDALGGSGAATLSEVGEEALSGFHNPAAVFAGDDAHASS